MTEVVQTTFLSGARFRRPPLLLPPLPPDAPDLRLHRGPGRPVEPQPQDEVVGDPPQAVEVERVAQLPGGRHGRALRSAADGPQNRRPGRLALLGPNLPAYGL